MSKDQVYDVIVIGAGVIGPCIATEMARQGRKVLIVEREWDKPSRIVGELMQPSGLKALKQLGMIKAVNNIEAIEVNGYYISYHGQSITIPYPDKSILSTIDTAPVPSAIVKGDEDKLVSDSTLNLKEWDESHTVKGVAFHHGNFLMNLRAICLSEPNVTKLHGNVVEILKKNDDDPESRVIGITVADQGDFKSRLVICCDGIYSKFRKEISASYVPTIGSYFVGLDLVDADMPSKYHGHVILGNHAPVLVYQISPHHSRILCAYRSTKLPNKNDVVNYLTSQVLPSLPEPLKPSFSTALQGDGNIYKAMPNQYLTARLNNIPGFVCVGDSLNMRHPLTGGGMTVGLNDAVLLCKLLSELDNEQLSSHEMVLAKMKEFHKQRKPLDCVINTLSIALYSLFAADNKYLTMLQKGCFLYFLKGGECVSGPIGLLSGLLPSSFVLFKHFFSVAFYSCYLNFQDKGIIGFPIALFENICTLATASYVLLPHLLRELLS